MQRAELEHTIRAATEILVIDEIVVIGSQAILGSWHEDDLPPQAVQSVEVDMAPMTDDDADRLDAAIGEFSQFHQTHGYYVQGVGRDTAVLPNGWEDRLVRLTGENTNGRTGLCLDPHDLCLAKLAAYREKDVTYVQALLEAGLVDSTVMLDRIDLMDTATARTKDLMRGQLATWQRLLAARQS